MPVYNYDHFIQAFYHSLIFLQPLFIALVLSDIVGYSAHDRRSHALGSQGVCDTPDRRSPSALKRL